MRGKHKTDIELIMQKALDEAHISYVAEYPIRCKYGYILDYAIPEKRICIECDGEPWHGGKKDKRRDGYLKSRGWTTLRFKGKEIKQDIHTCIKRIQEVIK